MVIISAGDPSCHTSPNEADQRHLGPMLHLPILDPSTPAEAHAMTRAAFELCEASRLPVLIRTTTRVAHTRGPVELGPAPRRVRSAGFVRDPARLRARSGQRAAHAPRAQGAHRDRPRVDGGVGLLPHPRARALTSCSRPARRPRPVADLLELAGATDRVAALAARHRASAARSASSSTALRGVERVLVVEELSPFLENALLALSARHRPLIEDPRQALRAPARGVRVRAPRSSSARSSRCFRHRRASTQEASPARWSPCVRHRSAQAVRTAQPSSRRARRSTKTSSTSTTSAATRWATRRRSAPPTRCSAWARASLWPPASPRSPASAPWASWATRPSSTPACRRCSTRSRRTPTSSRSCSTTRSPR